ncbi:unnamed protein product, partial [Ectocarpus fasciculatus]
MCDVSDMCEFCAGWAHKNTCADPTPVYLGDDIDCGILCDESDGVDNDVDCGVCIQSDCCRSVCPNGDVDCGDPHMQGLRGQRIDWSGVDGGWYSL